MKYRSREPTEQEIKIALASAVKKHGGRLPTQDVREEIVREFVLSLANFDPTDPLTDEEQVEMASVLLTSLNGHFTMHPGPIE